MRLTCASRVCVSLGSYGGQGAGGTGNPAVATPDGLWPLTAQEAALLTDPATVCQGWVTEPEGAPAALEFMVDTTGSMNDIAPSTGAQSKWQVMQTALPQALAQLPGSWSVGLSFFSRPNSCYEPAHAVPIAPLTAQQLAALGDAVQARGAAGYTPTEAAYRFALAELESWTATSGFAGANRNVVLLTDGVPTVDQDGCTLGSGPQNTISVEEYSHLIDTVASQTSATGIKTFVVGVPGSEDPQGASYDPMYQLSLLAEAGGTQLAGCIPSSGTSNGTTVNPRGTYCHYDMTQTTDFAGDLITTIGVMARGIVACDYPVPPAPTGQIIDPNRINLIYYDGAGSSYSVLQNTGPSCDRGWQFVDASATEIHICQITCDLMQSNPLASVSLTFGCIP